MQFYTVFTLTMINNNRVWNHTANIRVIKHAVAFMDARLSSVQLKWLLIECLYLGLYFIQNLLVPTAVVIK